MHGRLGVEAVRRSELPRRWSKRRLLLVVSSLIAGALVLVLSVVGFARSIGLVMHAVDAVGDIGQIAPERASPTGSAVTPGNPASSVTATAPSLRGSVGSGPGSSALPAAVAAPASTSRPAGGAEGGAETSEAEAAPIGGVAGVSGSGGDGANGAMGATGGVAGAAPTFWENVVQSALTLLGRTTASMCGRNTCNAGQVCCNASCGICTAAGSTCDQAPCTDGPRAPTAVLCGSAQCNDGQVCCNPSCGTCTLPGETCSDQKCQ